MFTACADSKVERLEQTRPQRVVLCYGHNAILLYSRQQILERQGCAVETVTSVAEYRAHLLQRTLAVVVFCQTLTALECEDAIALAVDCCPDTHLLVMYTHTLPGGTRHNYGALASHDGPAAFARTVCNLLSEQPT